MFTLESIGLDGWSSRFLREVASEIAEPLTKLYNISLQSSSIPLELKQCKVISHEIIAFSLCQHQIRVVSSANCKNLLNSTAEGIILANKKQKRSQSTALRDPTSCYKIPYH